MTTTMTNLNPSDSYKAKQYTEGDMYAALMVREWIEDVITHHTSLVPKYVTVDGKRTKISDLGKQLKTWASIEKEFPYLARVDDNEGSYGLRRICIELGAVIERAFEMFSSEDKELLIHGNQVFIAPGKSKQDWKGLGCFDFEIVPLCCSHAMELQHTAETLGATSDIRVSVEQMYDFLWHKIPKELRPERVDV